MYLDYYRLTEKPFQISTDPRFLFFGEKHKEALAVLRYGVLDDRGFLLLTGKVGTGKTTLIHSLLESLNESILPAAVPDPGLDLLDFYNYVAFAFGINKQYERKTAFLIDFTEFLHAAHHRGKRILLILDEAQRIDSRLLEEIRLLSNIEKKTTKLLNIFFVGQEEFLDTLKKTENRALRQRITISYHLEPLSGSETEDYIRHRLNVSGAKRDIFSGEAIEAVYAFSKGHPRLINIICDHALLTCFVNEKKSIHRETVLECVRELGITVEKPQEDDTEKPPEDLAPAMDVHEASRKLHGSCDASGSDEHRSENLGIVYKLTVLVLLASILLGGIGLIAYGDFGQRRFGIERLFQWISKSLEPGAYLAEAHRTKANSNITWHRIEKQGPDSMPAVHHERKAGFQPINEP